METRTKNLKVFQFISQNPGRSGVTKVMADIAKNTKIGAICLLKTTKSPRYESLQSIGDAGERMLMILLAKD